LGIGAVEQWSGPWFKPKWGSNEPGNGDSADQNGDLTDSFFRQMGISALVIQHDPHKKGVVYPLVN